MLYFKVWLPFFLEIFGKMCIAILVCRLCVINFKTNLIFLIKLFFYMIKKSRRKSKYLENQKNFSGELRSIFHHFKGLSVARNCLRPESVPLNFDWWKTFCENYKPKRVWLWLLYKTTEINCSSWLFAKLIQAQENYLISLDKVSILTCGILVIIKLKSFLWTKLVKNSLHAKSCP